MDKSELVKAYLKIRSIPVRQFKSKSKYLLCLNEVIPTEEVLSVLEMSEKGVFIKFLEDLAVYNNEVFELLKEYKKDRISS